MPLCLLVIISVFTTCRMFYVLWTHTLCSPCCALNLTEPCSQSYIPIVTSKRPFSACAYNFGGIQYHPVSVLRPLLSYYCGFFLHHDHFDSIQKDLRKVEEAY